MGKSFFIAATGTDIGKTFVTCELIRQCNEQSLAVNALKPVISGFSDSDPTTDTHLLLEALRNAATPDTVHRVSPFRFTAPLSPDQAAQKEGKVLQLGDIVDICRQAISKNNGHLFIEGVGGIMVPLNNTHTTLDLIQALNIPTIVVTGSYLGTLSHTLTTISTLEHTGIDIAHIIVNEAIPSGIPVEDTYQSLKHHTNIPITCIPHSNEQGNACPDLLPILMS